MRLLFPLALLACDNGDETTEPVADDTAADTEAPAGPQTFTVGNSGNADREGHTPRGFQGQGGGLFAGDNLNAGFPEGDGVQIFLSINLGRADGGEGDLLDGSWTVSEATLRAVSPPEVEGTPFADLGALNAEEVVFDMFSSELWDLEPPANGASCVFATEADGPYGCDLASGVQRALDEGRRWFNVRLRFDQAGDSDGVRDMVFFFDDDTNATSPGLFELSVTATQE